MKQLNSMLEGAEQLLCDTATILNKSKLNYIIIGGWSSYLLNKNEKIKHPGTKDVDILFEDSTIKCTLTEIIKMFLDNKFLVSAKHDFQLFKIYTIRGKEFVYNIDLLHPSESRNNPQMFVDHLDLDILDYDNISNKQIKSIVLPSSSIFFNGFIENYKCNFFEDEEHSEIKLLDNAGLILSKCESVSSSKRPRDSFDIYLAFNQPDSDKLINKLKQDQYKGEIEFLLGKLLCFIYKKSKDFNSNIKKYHDYKGDPAKEIKGIIENIMSKS